MKPIDDKPAAEVSDQPGQVQFQDAIFRELDAKLRQTPWNAGASEAHGVLTALACLGIKADAIRASAWLFRLEADEDLQIVEGMFAMACRDLNDTEFSFKLMLPDDTHPLGERVEAVSDWCQGFLQGIYHRDGTLPPDAGRQASEAVEDIREIGHLEKGFDEPEVSERALTDIVEFLRVAAQLIYDELQPARPAETQSVHLN